MTKLFNFIIFLAIVYLFFNISVSQFEKFSEFQKQSMIYGSPFKVMYAPHNKPLVNLPKMDSFNNKRKEAIVEDDHYDQEKEFDLENGSDINISDIISDIEGKSISEDSCGLKISTTKKEGDTNCDSSTLDNWKLNKTTSEIFNEITSDLNDDSPKTIKEIYNKMVTPMKGNTDNIKTQGNHTMHIDSNKYTTLKGQEKIVTQLTENLHANDPNYDSYSIFN